MKNLCRFFFIKKNVLLGAHTHADTHNKLVTTVTIIMGFTRCCKNKVNESEWLGDLEHFCVDWLLSGEVGVVSR